MFTTELISNILSKMKIGKAPGLDDISCNHLQYCHPIISMILCKLFNMIIATSHVRLAFGRSYTVPIPKCDVRNRSKTVDAFRGTSISPVISKLFEHAVLDRYGYYFVTSEHQFEFKKGLSCRHLIYSVTNVIEHYVANGSTVSICSLDLSKAFDEMNHYALFNKRMDKGFPNSLLNILKRWFNTTVTCIKWGKYYSHYFTLLAGVRQGVFCPLFFLLYLLMVW